jgi:heptosyltransferase-2
MKVAVIKPDHLGDFTLSIPTISAIGGRYPELTLYVSSSTRPLARFTFPELEVSTLDLPHLSKFGSLGARNGQLSNLHRFDLVFFLRRDQVFTPAWTELMARKSVLVEDRNDVHETRLQARAVWQTGLRYELPDSHTPGIEFPARPRSAGLCISAGFHANRWPTVRWIELGRKLQAEGVAVWIVCGPFEIEEAGLLAGMLGLDPSSRLIIGSADFGAFLERVGELDLVIGNDGGTAHICSLVAPVLSLFGGSPFRRYAPYGKHNRILTRLTACAPCCQYHESVINSCVTIECLSSIRAGTVLQAVFESRGIPGQSRTLADGCALFFGISHA